MGRKDSVLPPKLPLARPLDSALKGRRSSDSSPTAPKAETPKSAIGSHPPPTLCTRKFGYSFISASKLYLLYSKDEDFARAFANFFPKLRDFAQKKSKESLFALFSARNAV
jgi:hypothetical protein